MKEMTNKIIEKLDNTEEIKQMKELRDKLNKSIENGDSYDVTLDLSVQLDELIAKYYRNLGKEQNSPICKCESV